MLLEFTVGNFRSFHEPQTLSMVAGKIKSKDPALDKNNIMQQDKHPPLLTSAAVYGANASGKSNLVQALDFMRSFVLDSLKETRATGGIDVEPFLLSTTTITQPAHFEIVFIESGKQYRYGFEVTKERVTAEWLYFVPSTREARLFEREGDKIEMGSYFRREGRDLEQHTRPNALFLSVAAQFNGPIAQKLVKWFRKKLGIISGLQDIAIRFYTMQQLLDGEYAAGIRELICRLDLGISDLQATRMPRQSPSIPENMPDEMRRALLLLWDASDEEQLAVQTVHKQFNENGVPVDDISFQLSKQESAGTQKLFAMAGPLLDTLHGRDVLVVDELDARLHPLLAREIIALFHNKAVNRHGAQLIFTTHDTNLLDNTLLRRDQIWFVEKDRQGASHLYSLAEFRVRNDLDYERGYIQGRFGAVPYLSHIDTIIGEMDAPLA